MGFTGCEMTQVSLDEVERVVTCAVEHGYRYNGRKLGQRIPNGLGLGG